MKVGSRGGDVAALQAALNESGVTEALVEDGIFGPATERSVKVMQAHLGLPATGEAEHGLLAALRTWDVVPANVTSAMLSEAAYRLKVDYEAVSAIVTVESRGVPFLASGKPVILFERHIMRRRLLRRGIDPKGSGHRDLMHSPDIVNADPGGYLGGEAEWQRFERAAEIHREAAIESCSWGLMQVMGFHWERLNYLSPESWYERMHKGVQWHIEAFVRFIEGDPILLQALREHRWAAVARRYNGPAYARNRYDERLRSEFDLLSGDRA